MKRSPMRMVDLETRQPVTTNYIRHSSSENQILQQHLALLSQTLVTVSKCSKQTPVERRIGQKFFRVIAPDVRTLRAFIEITTTPSKLCKTRKRDFGHDEAHHIFRHAGKITRLVRFVQRRNFCESSLKLHRMSLLPSFDSMWLIVRSRPIVSHLDQCAFWKNVVVRTGNMNCKANYSTKKAPKKAHFESFSAASICSKVHHFEKSSQRTLEP